jgi:hypothetical protein
MLKKDTGSLLNLVLAVGCLVLGHGTFASAGTLNKLDGDSEQRMEGRCRFHGEFDGDKKGGGFAVHCRARLRFDKKDLYNSIQDDRRRGGFELECDDETLYDDGLRIQTDHDGGRGRRGMDVTFSGIGRGSPKITVADFQFDHEDRCETGNLDAVLTFQRWGYSYRIAGTCEFMGQMPTALN